MFGRYSRSKNSIFSCWTSRSSLIKNLPNPSQLIRRAVYAPFSVGDFLPRGRRAGFGRNRVLPESASFLFTRSLRAHSAPATTESADRQKVIVIEKHKRQILPRFL